MPTGRSAGDRFGPIVLVGGVDVSLACLKALCDQGLPPALTVSYDDSRASASGFADFGPAADRYGLDLVRTRSVNDEGLVQRIAELSSSVVFVIGWSELIRLPLLTLPLNGCVGIHPTSLPEGRGRAPIPWTILKGLRRTASTMFLLGDGVDDGPVVGKVELEVEEREDAGTLYAKHRGAHVELIRRHAWDLAAGRIEAVPQAHRRATSWPRRRPEEGRIDWSKSAEEVDRLVRAVTRPFPGAFTETPAGSARIWRAAPVGLDAARPPGSIWWGEDVLHVACGDGALRVLDADAELETLPASDQATRTSTP